MAESPFELMPTSQMTPEEIMMLIERQQLMQPGAYVPPMPSTAPPEAPFVPSQTEGLPFEGQDLPQGSVDFESGRKFTDLLSAPAKGVVGQFDKAGEAVKDTMVDPSISNAANAGVQTGAALMRPGMMLGSAAIGVGDALLKDTGLSPFTSTAEARGKKKGAPPEPGSEEEFRWAQDRVSKRDYRSPAERRDLEGILSRYRAKLDKDTDSQRALAEERKRDKLEEYDRRVQGAEAARDREMGRDKRYEDTAIGAFHNKVGPVAPVLTAGLFGGLGRLAHGPLGGKGLQYAEGVMGAGLGLNAKDIHEGFYTPSENPRRKALEEYGLELPPGHERKQESLDTARGMDKENPVQEAALKRLRDPTTMAIRGGLMAAEGLAGPLAAGLVGAPRNAMRTIAEKGFLGSKERALQGGQGQVAPTLPGGPLQPSGGPQAALPPPQTVAKPVGAQKPGDVVINSKAAQEAARAHREALTKHRGDPEVAAFFETNKGLGPDQLRRAFADQFGTSLKRNSIRNLQASIGKDAAAKGLADAKAQLADTARTAQGEARAIWDAIAQDGNRSFKAVQQIMPEMRQAFPAFQDMTDAQLRAVLRKAARGQ